MKKLLVLAMAAAVVSLMGACKKEGVYNPKQKIAKVYSESSSTNSYFDGTEWHTNSYTQPKELDEEWIWDGKLLTQIAYPYTSEDDNGNVTTKYEYTKFTYDGKQLTEVSSDWERMAITYDGKKLDKIELYYDYYKASSEPNAILTFTYDGKKISKMTANIEDEEIGKGKNGRPQMGRMTRMLLQSLTPDVRGTEKMLASTCEKARKAGAKGRVNVDMLLTWDGNNISKIEAKYMGMTVQTIEYTYDDKNNPYQGFLFTLAGDLPFEDNPLGFGNENNITSSKMYEPGDEKPYTENYTYTYDGKWPVSCSTKHENADDYNRYSYTSTVYYEYK